MGIEAKEKVQREMVADYLFTLYSSITELDYSHGFRAEYSDVEVHKGLTGIT